MVLVAVVIVVVIIVVVGVDYNRVAIAAVAIAAGGIETSICKAWRKHLAFCNKKHSLQGV